MALDKKSNNTGAGSGATTSLLMVNGLGGCAGEEMSSVVYIQSRFVLRRRRGRESSSIDLYVTFFYKFLRMAPKMCTLVSDCSFAR